MQHGLTMVVGPPGTGKTDVAVQIISNIYHNFPNERTLIITHSNQALNQLFEKVCDDVLPVDNDALPVDDDDVLLIAGDVLRFVMTYFWFVMNYFRFVNMYFRFKKTLLWFMTIYFRL